MRLLALSLPTQGEIDSFPGMRSELAGGDLGTLLSGGINIAFFIAAFLVVFWMSWGIFQYIFAGGNKEGLAKARTRIIYSIVGFIILVLAFSISLFFREVTGVVTPSITPVSIPTS